MIVGFLLDTIPGRSVDFWGWSYGMMADRHIRTQWKLSHRNDLYSGQ